MLDIYESYDSQEDRENAVMMENAEIELERLLLTQQALDAQRALNLRAAEAAVVLESGSVDDLMLYYEEAKEKTADTEGGVLSKIWDAIKNFFHSIGDAFSKKKVPDEVDEADVKNVDKAKGILGKLKSALAQNSILKIAAAIVSAGLMTLTAFALIKKTGKKKKVDGKQMSTELTAIEKETTTLIDRVKGKFTGSKDSADANKEIDSGNGEKKSVKDILLFPFRKLAEMVKSIFTSITTKVEEKKEERYVKKGDKEHENSKEYIEKQRNEQDAKVRKEAESVNKRIETYCYNHGLDPKNTADRATAMDALNIPMDESAEDLDDILDSMFMEESSSDGEIDTADIEDPFEYDFSESFDDDGNRIDGEYMESGALDEIAALLATI